jgi:hypothetical protein
MSLNDLEKRLAGFRKKTSGGKRPPQISGEEEDVPKTLSEKILDFEDELEDKHRWLKRTLLLGSVVAFVILALGLLFIFSYVTSSRDVTIEITSDSEISRGAPFSVEVSVTNNSGGLIKNASISLNLPRGIIAPDSGRDRSVVTEDIGDLASGNLVKRAYSLIPVSEVGSKETIIASLSYAISTGARFEVRENQDVEVESSAIAMKVDVPGQILSGSTFSVDVDYKNESDFNFSSLVLEADYPNTFKFDSSSIPPASLNNYWQLGSLGGSASGTVTISGHLDLSAGTGVAVPIKLSASFGGQNYPIAEDVINLSPSSSPLSLSIFVNNQSDYLAQVGDTLNYSVQYRNSSGIALSEAKITISVSGNMLDWSSLKTDGIVDSGARTISWNSSNLPALRMLDPGAGGQLDFQIKLKSAFNLERLNDRNFSVRVKVVMSSPSVPYYLSSSVTSVEAFSDVKVSGMVSVVAQGYFNDDGSGLSNKGTLPPRVGQPTQYIIHWLIRNFSTDLNNVEVKAVLASGVKWVTAGPANLGTPVFYDSGSNSVVWNIDRVAATKGVLSEPAEAVFQIEAVPDSSMVGMPETLIKTTYLKGTDNFTGQELTSQFIPVTTAMLDDAVSALESIVVR